MSLKEEKDRLAAESAAEVHRLHQEAADLRSQLGEEKKAREKLEVGRSKKEGHVKRHQSPSLENLIVKARMPSFTF